MLEALGKVEIPMGRDNFWRKGTVIRAGVLRGEGLEGCLGSHLEVGEEIKKSDCKGTLRQGRATAKVSSRLADLSIAN